jgi:outer membrane immunogenic protein
MKNSIFATALLVLVLGCGCAWAAGPAATTYNWTGFYGGLNAGVAANDSNYTVGQAGLVTQVAPFLTDSGNFNNTAATIGGQLGYNYQVGSLVFGLETDFNYDSSEDSIYRSVQIIPGPPLPFMNANLFVNQKIDYFGTLRARFGFTPADRFLIYGTGGLAYGDVSSRSSVQYFPTELYAAGSSSGMQTGWAVGAGGEYALNNCWSVKLEYLYIDLGSRTYTYPFQTPFPAGSTSTTTIDTAQHVIRVGLNYKF